MSAVGRHRDVDDSYFDDTELKFGIEVEMEHTDSRAIAKEIAKDHLAEIQDYYSRLMDMEERAKTEMDEAPLYNGLLAGCNVFSGARLDRAKSYAKSLPMRFGRILKKKTKRDLENLVIGLSMLVDPSKLADPRVIKAFAKEPELLMALRELKP